MVVCIYFKVKIYIKLFDDYKKKMESQRDSTAPSLNVPGLDSIPGILCGPLSFIFQE